MKTNGFIVTALLALAAGVLPPAAARADMVMYDESNFVSGAQAFSETLDITASGTVTMTLSGVPWLDAVTDVTGFLTSASGVLAPVDQGAGALSGSETFNVGAGTFYAHWFGDAQGASGLGVLSAKIVFTPNAPAVALPASWLLLLSGLIVMARLKLRLPDRKPMDGVPA